MRDRKMMLLIAGMAVAVTAACSKPADKTETKIETTTTSPQSRVETTQETTQVGSTMEGKTETKVKTDDGTVKTNVGTFVGTVTVYKPGKEIEVLTGESDRHSFSLDSKDVAVSIDGTVVVGAKVHVVEEKGDKGSRITVSVDRM